MNPIYYDVLIHYMKIVYQSTPARANLIFYHPFLSSNWYKSLRFRARQSTELSFTTFSLTPVFYSAFKSTLCFWEMNRSFLIVFIAFTELTFGKFWIGHCVVFCVHCHKQLRLDHQPLFGKGARAPPPKARRFFSGRDADQTRESGGNQAYKQQ